MQIAKTLTAAALAFSFAAAPALAADPTGTWAATDGKSRYVISYCGDGNALCGKLIWLRDKDDKNRPYLNQVVVQGAQAAENKWKGTVVHEGDTYDGTMVMTGEDSLKVNGCQAIFCKTVDLSRV